jgi:RNA polymerase sigma factor (sigma-70 family)
VSTPARIAAYARRVPALTDPSDRTRGDVRDLTAQLDRGHRMDRELARALGRSEPVRAAASADYLSGLEAAERRLVEIDPELVVAAQRGDQTARARLVELCLPLVSAIARTYRVGQVQRAELLQEGIVGLLRALTRFDAARGTPFWGYATWWVRQAMQQLVSELTRPVVLSDRALRHLARLKEAHREAVLDGERDPGRARLAQRTGLTLDQVDDLLATERTPRSLQEPVSGEQGEIGTFGDLLVDPLADGEYERVLDAIEAEQVHALLAGLSDRERDVLRARYGLDGEELSLREIGARLGLSGERVRQIERRALGKLAASAGPRGGAR